MHRTSPWLSGLSAGVLVTILAACSSSAAPGAASAGPPGDPGEATDAAAPPEEPTEDAAPARPLDACGAIAKSKCTPANEGSVVRGIVRFDPAHFAGKPKPTLRVFLHHQMLVKDTEAKQGGHPHAWTSVTDVDLVKGEAKFTLDMCDLGTAMYSEENCGFNAVVMLDEDGSNNPDTQGAIALVPQKGELVAMLPLEISCHAPSPCLELDAKCAAGEACTTYTPPTSCACKPAKCPSDDKICG